MAFYECVFIIRQDVSASDAHKLGDKMAKVISEHDGALVKKEYWGLKNLAYPIKKNKRGHYIMLGVSSPVAATEEFKRQCKINEDIIKCIVVKTNSVDSLPSIMMQAPAEANLGSGGRNSDENIAG